MNKMKAALFILYLFASISGIAQCKTVLYASEFSDFRNAINTSTAQSMPLVISDTIELANDCIPDHHQPFDGNLTIMAEPGKRGVIVFDFRKAADIQLFGLILGTGNFTFINIDFVCRQQTSDGTATAITTEPGSIYFNVFTNCRFIGKWNTSYVGKGKGITIFNKCGFDAKAISGKGDQITYIQ